MGEPVFEKVSFEQKKTDVVEQIKVECKTQVVAEEVKNILVVSPFSFIEMADISNTTIKYNGKATFYISYIDKDGNIKKCECGNEINGELIDQNLLDNTKIRLEIILEKTDYDLSGTYLSVSAIFSIKVKITQPIYSDALVGGEKIFVDTSELSVLCGNGKRISNYPIEEQFELSYPVAEVLFHRAEAIITAVQCGVGCIIVDGQVLLSLVLLQNNDKRDIIKEQRCLPFRMEIECEEAMPSMPATAFVKEKSLSTDVGVDEQGGNSVVSVSVYLQFEGEAFSSNSYNLAKDAFCSENEIELVKQDLLQFTPLEIIHQSFPILGKSQVGEIPLGATVIDSCIERANILSIKQQDGLLVVMGEYTSTVYFKDNDNKIFSRKIEIAFEKSIEWQACGRIEFEFFARAFKGSAKILSSTEIEASAEIFLTIYPIAVQNRSIISEVKLLEQKEENQNALSIYIALKDEELFSLAKRLSVCPEALVQTNKDLQFPLTGNERIVVYRQK